MKTEIASNFYNNAGVPDQNIQFSEKSTRLMNKIRGYCEDLFYPNVKVLDIGCGNGRYLFEFEKMDAIATGIDCAEKVVEYAKNFAKKINSTSEFIACDAIDMPFQDNSFDLIFLVSNNIVEYSYNDIDELCKQIVRILRPNGVFCVSIQDMFIQKNGKIYDINNYCFEIGTITSHYTIPDKGTFLYQYYYWTVAIARFIFSKYFNKINIKKEDDKDFWIECRK